MQRAIVSSPYEFEVIEEASPILKEGYAVVEIVYCGVCGSDLHVYEGKHPKVKPPAALGHEAVGLIKEIDLTNDYFKVGDKVAVVPLIGCQKCDYCKQGYPNLCIDRKVIGFQVPGCYAEEALIPLDNLIKLEDDCDLLGGALLEPLAVVVHSSRLIERLTHSAKNVIITGAGTIGILTGLYFQENTGMNVYFVEINPDRSRLAQTLGFKVFTSIQDIPAEGSRPIAIECTGNKKVLDGLIELDPAPEILVILGTFDKTQTISIFEMCKRETFIIGSQMYTKEDLQKATALLNRPLKNKFKEIVVSKKYTLHEAREAFDEALSSKNGTKVIIKI